MAPDISFKNEHISTLEFKILVALLVGYDFDLSLGLNALCGIWLVLYGNIEKTPMEFLLFSSSSKNG